MKNIFLVTIFSILISVSAFANEKRLVCEGDKSSLKITLIGNTVASASVSGWLNYNVVGPLPLSVDANGTAHYEFIVNDSYDVRTYFGLAVLEGLVVKRELILSGNDSDNYVGSVVAENDDAFRCLPY